MTARWQARTGCAVNTHSVVWDHYGCDHDEGDCTPRGDIICTETEAENPGAECRRLCDTCEWMDICDGDGACDYCHPDAPEAEAVAGWHCTSGHPARYVTHCNYAEWITDGGDIRDLGPDLPPGERHHDGPISVEWDGDAYVWDYTHAEVTA